MVLAGPSMQAAAVHASELNAKKTFLSLISRTHRRPGHSYRMPVCVGHIKQLAIQSSAWRWSRATVKAGKEQVRARNKNHRRFARCCFLLLAVHAVVDPRMDHLVLFNSAVTLGLLVGVAHEC